MFFFTKVTGSSENLYNNSCFVVVFWSAVRFGHNLAAIFRKYTHEIYLTCWSAF